MCIEKIFFLVSLLLLNQRVKTKEHILRGKEQKQNIKRQKLKTQKIIFWIWFVFFLLCRAVLNTHLRFIDIKLKVLPIKFEIEQTCKPSKCKDDVDFNVKRLISDICTFLKFYNACLFYVSFFECGLSTRQYDFLYNQVDKKQM